MEEDFQVKRLKRKIDQMDSEIEGHETQIEEHKIKIENIERMKAHYEERLKKAEEKQSDNSEE